MSETAAPEGGLSPFVILAAAVAALGGLLFGYDTGIISAALLFVADDFQLSDAAQQIVVSSLLGGAVVGALLAGPFSDRYGRRSCILITAVIFVVGAVAAALAWNVVTLVAARVLLGVAIGAASLVTPVYIAEIAPARVRGGLVSLQQFMITVGLLTAYLVGYVLEPAQAWRWMLGLGAVPGAVLLLGMAVMPESPRWLLGRGRRQEARGVLRRVRGAGDDVEGEVRAIDDQIGLEAGTGYRELFSRDLRPALIVGVGVAVFNQLVGVNAVIYYAPTILTDAGFADSSAILATVGIGVVNVAVTAVALALIDRLGRKPLLMTGTVILVLSLFTLGLAYLLPGGSTRGSLLVGALMVYIASFAVSWGMAIWLLNAEVYPLRVRGKGAGAGSVSHWAVDALVSLTFLSLINALGATSTFWLYGLFALAALIFAWRLVPETRGRSIEQIEADLQRRL